MFGGIVVNIIKKTIAVACLFGAFIFLNAGFTGSSKIAPDDYGCKDLEECGGAASCGEEGEPTGLFCGILCESGNLILCPIP